MAVDLREYAARSTVRLTTVGRKSGRSHAVPIWFVAAGPDRIFVQHVRGPTADWYKNLLKNPSVQLDFGSGPLNATAKPIADQQAIRAVLRDIRRKYIVAWVFQLLGMTRKAVAAEIRIEGESNK